MKFGINMLNISRIHGSRNQCERREQVVALPPIRRAVARNI